MHIALFYDLGFNVFSNGLAKTGKMTKIYFSKENNVYVALLFKPWLYVETLTDLYS